MTKPRVLVIVGPTASGKSELAVKLARRFDGEVVSADSRQVYRGLDIGSGKITKKEMRGIPHHLLDVANPKQQFSAAQYQKLAEQKIKAIIRRGKLPIICGGTGFYVQTIIDPSLLPPVPPNPALRKRLEKLTPDQLFSRLEKLAPERAKTIDRHNPRRLIRAFEVAIALGKVPKTKSAPLPYQTLKLGLKVEGKKLKEKINKRLAARLKQGLITEVQRLHQQGLSWKRLHGLGLEYRYVAVFLRKRGETAALLQQLETAIWHYAKRQLTWFKRDKEIHWVKNYREAEKLTKQFLVN